MTETLDEQLAKIPSDLQAVLKRHRFNEAHFKALSRALKEGRGSDNFVAGKIEAPREEDVARLPAAGSAEYSRLNALGQELLRQGQVALVVLAGGMATRMGGVVKALSDALPGKSFLDLRLAEAEAIRKRYGTTPPLWLMTSHTTDEPIRNALGSKLDGERVATFTQHLSLRFTPEGDIFFDAQGRPSEHSPGHGDLPDALRESGLLDKFLSRGGKIVMMSNVDNLGGTLDPLLIGFHAEHGQAVTCELVEKLASDRGGIPVYLDGKLCVLEEFRIPPSFDPESVRVFNTNVFWFDARALRDSNFAFTYFAVKKKVSEKSVVQFERLVNEVTSHLSTRYLLSPRTGAASRFLPVKDPEELARRQDEIRMVAEARGMLP